MEDFLFLADSYHAALLLLSRIETMLARQSLLRNPKKGVRTPTQVSDHMGLTIDLRSGEFRAPQAKLQHLAQ
jgi:hypothetical protein